MPQLARRHERHLRPGERRPLRGGDARLRQFLRREVEGPEAEASEGEEEEDGCCEEGEGEEGGVGGGAEDEWEMRRGGG